jgi:CMP-N-acetylneuraminic acid synthetase
MSYHGLTVLAVVPARGGSKAIPRKNLQKINNISLVGRAAKIAVSIPWIDHAVLSTDDPEIADEGRRFGLDIPFMRPPELAEDFSTSVDMWKHAWLTSEEHYSMRFDISILLEPTSPLRIKEDIEKTMSALMNGDHLAAATVSKAPAHFTPHKCLTVDSQGYIGFYLQNGPQFSIRQKIPSYYFRNGICYAVQRETIINKGQILEENCVAVVIERPVVNIDEPYELDLAEFLMKHKRHNAS